MALEIQLIEIAFKMNRGLSYNRLFLYLQKENIVEVCRYKPKIMAFESSFWSSYELLKICFLGGLYLKL